MALDDRYANKFAPLDSTAIYPKPGHKLLYPPMTGEIKCPRLYLCLAHSIPSPPLLMQHMHQPITKWYDPLHIITWSYWFIDLDFTCFHRCLCPSAPSLAQASPPRGPSLQSLRLALHACNRSIKSSHVLIFSTLITWLNVMSHLQWAPSSSHVWALQHLHAIFTFMHMLLTHMYMWTNHLCISHKYN